MIIYLIATIFKSSFSSCFEIGVTRFSKVAATRFVTGNTLTILVRTTKALRISIYSVDSKQVPNA